MNKYEKSILFKPLLMKIFYGIIAVINVAIPLNSDGTWSFSLFQFGIIAVWFYALLCALGYFCISTNEIQGDMELYETKTPILPLVFVRIVEGGFYWITAPHDFNWTYFGALIVIDIVYLVFLMMDKATYGYARSV